MPYPDGVDSIVDSTKSANCEVDAGIDLILLRDIELDDSRLIAAVRSYFLGLFSCNFSRLFGKVGKDNTLNAGFGQSERSIFPKATPSL